MDDQKIWNLIQIQTTSECSGNCIICPYPNSWHKKHPGYMKEELFLHVLEEIKAYTGDYTAKICPYLMQDPFSDKKIVDRVETIFQHFPNCYVELSTNAILLDPDKAEQLVDIIKKYDKKKRSEMWISFHGSDKNTWETMTGRSGYEKARDNTIDFLQINEGTMKVSLNASGISRDQQMFFFSQEDWIKNLTKMFAATDVPDKNLFYKYFSFHNRAGKVRLGSWNGNEFHREISNFIPFSCWRYSKGLHILYEGSVVPCCMCYDKDEVWGNLQKQTLQKIWEGKRRGDFIDKAVGVKKSNDSFICACCMSTGG